jgi:hypothetical protein
MTMTPRLRKFALTAHVTSSVGWLGAVVAYLVLAVATLTNQDAQMVRAAHLAMEPITRYVIVPLALASLLTGVVQSLGTPWGLLRHYWVIAKLLLTVVATIVLLQFTKTLNYMAGVAADPTTSITALHELGKSPVLHSSVGLLVLLVTTVLSVYKPRGMTRYGWRKKNEQRKESQP